MKIKLELPDELMLRVKVHPAQSDQTLKDTVAQLLEAGLSAVLTKPPKSAPPTPLRLRLCQPAPLSIADIEAAIESGRGWLVGAAGSSAYGARFVAASPTDRLPLITEDARLRAAVPGQTQSLAEAPAA